MGRSILCQRGRQMLSSFLTWALLTHFCLVLPTMTQFSGWSHSSWDSLSTSINRYRRHSLCLMYVFLLRSAATSHYLWSSPILSKCSGRHPQQKPQLPIFHPKEALLVGLWVPYHYSLMASSFLQLLQMYSCMGWGWYTCPTYYSCPYTREYQSLMQ